MPYKHPNGCTCLTFAEALNRMGEAEGKSGGEVLTEVMDDLRKENEKEESQMSKPEVALRHLLHEAIRDYKQYVLDYDNAKQNNGEYPDYSAPIPCQVLEVLEVEMNRGLRSGNCILSARVLCLDGKERIATLISDWDSGDFYNPPEEETYLTWKDTPTQS
jgi:hypothetical protein